MMPCTNNCLCSKKQDFNALEPKFVDDDIIISIKVI